MAKPPSDYSPGGRAHTVLAQLAAEPMTRRALDGFEPNARRRRKLPFMLDAMMAEGLIVRALGHCRLTDEGAALLEHLDRMASVRFATARAA